jgi:23S rRNA pseudouridine2605 synthase
MDNLIRLHKYLADCGCCSRRQAEKLIEQGKVMVNGTPAVIGQAIDPDADKITVDNKPVRNVNKKHTYIMMYKPRGYVTTMSDELGRKCVKDLLKDMNARVFPIGRLDRDSEGMLLFTDDGELANAVSSPQTHIPKTYRIP